MSIVLIPRCKTESSITLQGGSQKKIFSQNISSQADYYIKGR